MLEFDHTGFFPRENVMTQHPASFTLSADLQLQELRQAELYVDSIRRVNEEENLEAGLLSGMSRILKNAENALSATKSALMRAYLSNAGLR